MSILVIIDLYSNTIRRLLQTLTMLLVIIFFPSSYVYNFLLCYVINHFLQKQLFQYPFSFFKKNYIHLIVNP